MAEKIDVNYDQIKQIGARFNTKADEINQLIKTLTSNVDNLRGGGWVGEGADSFYAEMENLIFPTFMNLCNALQETQQTLNNISTDFTKAEEEARDLVIVEA